VYTLFALMLNTTTIIILLIVGILLFGKQLPEVGKSLAKLIREFQNGLRGVEDQVKGSLLGEERLPAPAPPSTEPVRPAMPRRVTASAPKFVEPEAPPASADQQARAEPMV
jgi:sec-independent protein translocase protein TatA